MSHSESKVYQLATVYEI